MAKVIGLVNLHSDIEFTGLTERRPGLCKLPWSLWNY